MDGNKDLIFQVPAEISNIKTMARGVLRIQVDTQEEMQASSKMTLMELHEKFGWFTFVVRENNGKIKAKDILDLPELDDKTEFKKSKTPSQRLHDILFVYHKKALGGKPEDFDAWRIKEMDRVGNKYKERIPNDTD